MLLNPVSSKRALPLLGALYLFGATLIFAAVQATGATEMHWAGLLYASLFITTIFCGVRASPSPPWVLQLGDFLALCFGMVVLSSLLIHRLPGQSEAVEGIGRFVLITCGAYLAGRLISVNQLPVFMAMVGSASLLVLLLGWLGYVLSPPPVPGRWAVFGVNHGNLLVGFAGAVLGSILGAMAITGGSVAGARGDGRWYLSLTCLGGVCFASALWFLARGFVLATLLSLGFLALAHLHARRSLKSLLPAVTVFVVYLLMALAVVQMMPHEHVEHIARPASIGVSECVICLGKPELEDAPTVGIDLASDDSISIRLGLYCAALAEFVSSPIIGVGFGQFGSAAGVPAGMYPHSTLLQVAAELGVLGLIPFLGLVIVSARAMWGVPHNGQNAGCVGAAAFSLFLLIVLSDQVYGDIAQASGLGLFCGLASSLRSRPLPAQVPA